VGGSPCGSTTCAGQPAGDESGRPSSASLFSDEGLPPHENRILFLLKADQATHIDEIVEQLETEMSPFRSFAALIGVGGESEAYAGEEFCKKLLRSSD
jgi:hypothetical protein